MRPLAYVILVIIGVLCFGIHRFTGSFLCFIGGLFLLWSVWCVICAAWPKCREPNHKFPKGDTVRDCIVWAVYAFIIGAVVFVVGFKFKV